MTAPKRAAHVKQRLEQEIVTGLLMPGARLDEASLADRFAVSRTPVREALQSLSSIGLVEIRPRRGAVVASVGILELMEMFEVMAELEGMCGRLAAKRMTGDEKKRLCQAHQDARSCVLKGDHDGYYDANVEFHELIYRGSHNGFLGEQTMTLRNRLSPYRRLQLRKRDRLVESFNEHETIMGVIFVGDAAKADRFLQSHVTVQGGSFNDFIASLPTEILKNTG